MHNSIRLCRKKFIAAIIYYMFYSLLLFIRVCKGKGKHPQNSVLVIDLELIGDAVMVMPMIQNLLLNRDKVASLDVLCLNVQRDIFETCASIRRVYCLKSKTAFLRCNKLVRSVKRLVYCYYIVRYVCKNLYGNYTTVIVPRWDTEEECSAVIALLTDAEARIAYSEKVHEYRALHNTGSDMYFTKTFLCKAECHESDKFLKLIEQAGYSVYDSGVSLPYERLEVFQDVSLLKPYAVLALDVSKEDREWDVENFAAVGKWLVKRGVRIVLLGTKKAYADKFVVLLGKQFCTSLVGRTTIRDAINIIGSSSLYLGCNTGLLHIAGAVGTKGVVLFSGYDGESASEAYAPLRMRPKSDKIEVMQPKREEASRIVKLINLIKPVDVIRQLEKIL